MTVKYQINTTPSVTIGSHTLYQIECVTPFGSITTGDKGCYLETTDQLSLVGNCWADTTSYIMGESLITGTASLIGSTVMDSVAISGNATVINSVIAGSAVVKGASTLSGCRVWGNASINMDTAVETIIGAAIYDHAVIENAPTINSAEIYEHAKVYGEATVGDGTKWIPKIHENSEVYGTAVVKGKSETKGYSKVHGTAILDGNFIAKGNDDISGEVSLSTPENV